MRVLITSGGTKVPIDRVRDITNMSNGTFGSRIAHEALLAGHDVEFLCAKHSITPFTMTLDYSAEDAPARKRWERDLNAWGDFWNFCEAHRHQYQETRFRNYDDYSELLERLVAIGKPDMVILAAAVSDYGCMNAVDGKIRTRGEMALEMYPLPKLINRVKQWHPDCCLVGFKLLVGSTDEQLFEASMKSILENQCDLVVANDLRDLQANDHRLILVPKDRSVRVRMKSESEDPYYLAQKVMEEAVRCHEKFCSASPVA